MFYLTRSIAVIRVADVFRRIGTPVDRELRAANLPDDLESYRDSYYATELGYRFLERCQKIERVEDLGWQAYSQFRPSDFSSAFLTAANHAQTIHEQLRLLLASLRGESNYHTNGLFVRGDECKVFFGDPKIPIEFDYSIYQWSRLMYVITFCRNAFGKDWYPDAIGFIGKHAPCDEARATFSHTDFRFGQRTTWMSLPTSLLSRPAVNIRADDRNPRIRQVWQSGQDTSLPAQLRAVIAPYLSRGRPSIDLAAEIAGLSRRTLQRRLGEYGLTYSKLLDQCAFDVARDLLVDDSIKVTDIALSIGYDDPSHFARAFRRVAGVSPTQYREHI